MASVELQLEYRANQTELIRYCTCGKQKQVYRIPKEVSEDDIINSRAYTIEIINTFLWDGYHLDCPKTIEPYSKYLARESVKNEFQNELEDVINDI